jgi:hypothetical protein
MLARKRIEDAPKRVARCCSREFANGDKRTLRIAAELDALATMQPIKREIKD